jgi:maltodextrin utilization protein YvdJ
MYHPETVVRQMIQTIEQQIAQQGSPNQTIADTNQGQGTVTGTIQ